jgi:hypothetical protein
MENYVIRFNESEREAVLEILSRSNDIIINKVEEASVGITIQFDDSEEAYRTLIEQIERELHPTGSVIIRVETFATDGANTGSAPV